MKTINILIIALIAMIALVGIVSADSASAYSSVNAYNGGSATANSIAISYGNYGVLDAFTYGTGNAYADAYSGVCTNVICVARWSHYP